MKLFRLENIARRQRRYLVFDVLIAALAVVILTIHIAVFSDATVTVAKPVPYAAPETIYVYGTAPVTLDGQPEDAVATTPASAPTPGS